MIDISYEKLDDYNYALDILEIYFKQHIKSLLELHEMEEILKRSRERQTVPIRGIHQTFMDYRKKYQDYSIPTDEEKKMWGELLGIWQ